MTTNPCPFCSPDAETCEHPPPVDRREIMRDLLRGPS